MNLSADCADPALLAPAAIEARSFAIIDAEVPEPRPFAGAAWSVARRLIHTSGDTTLAASLSLPDGAIRSGVAALRAGAPVFTDTRMAAAGIPVRRLAPFGSSVVCLLDLPGAAPHDPHSAITRARAAMLAAAPLLPGSLLAVGNAPTALFTLLELVRQGLTPPALVIGMPVGFVNAAEAKEALAQSGLPALILHGRKGGSNLAAAAVNALTILAGEGREEGEKRSPAATGELRSR